MVHVGVLHVHDRPGPFFVLCHGEEVTAGRVFLSIVRRWLRLWFGGGPMSNFALVWFRKGFLNYNVCAFMGKNNQIFR